MNNEIVEFTADGPFDLVIPIKCIWLEVYHNGGERNEKYGSPSYNVHVLESGRMYSVDKKTWLRLREEMKK